MTDTLGVAEIDGQHVELLPARTVLSLISTGGCGCEGGGSHGAGGHGGESEGGNGGIGGAGGTGIGGIGANL